MRRRPQSSEGPAGLAARRVGLRARKRWKARPKLFTSRREHAPREGAFICLSF